jgi:hypothetical protein
VKSGKSRARRRNTIQYADGDSEDRPRLFSSYFKEDQSRKKAQRERAKERRQQCSLMLQQKRKTKEEKDSNAR